MSEKAGKWTNLNGCPLRLGFIHFLPVLAKISLDILFCELNCGLDRSAGSVKICQFPSWTDR